MRNWTAWLRWSNKLEMKDGDAMVGAQIVESFSHRADAALPALFDTALKGAALLLLAMILIWFLRRTSAALRHVVWALALAGLAALPVLSVILPAWQIRILPGRTARIVADVRTKVPISIRFVPDSAHSETPGPQLEARPAGRKKVADDAFVSPETVAPTPPTVGGYRQLWRRVCGIRL